MTSASIVVMTGANRGIGFEISRQLANRGKIREAYKAMEEFIKEHLNFE
jgi:NAD(P)-dependent dehydrogenase (short-subunit alcohol dehydrogenase family)